MMNFNEEVYRSVVEARREQLRKITYGKNTFKRLIIIKKKNWIMRLREA
ncbi:hypothetical protein QGM71_18735 [Virgibacillus sp. C22-A2]|uniref:Uncharacterized protein n=1 Tax=Virgibacillus tibetensis TaxID=3042313 RepID=A0ABU6KJM0_9BACI|nr:hypothetical protein [Virgibacillus sp. C22-A2]